MTRPFQPHRSTLHRWRLKHSRCAHRSDMKWLGWWLLMGWMHLVVVSSSTASNISEPLLFKCFESTEELWAAVDAMLLQVAMLYDDDTNTIEEANVIAVKSANTTTGTNTDTTDSVTPNDTNTTTTTAAAEDMYGADINAWCVGKVSNFSHTFSANRNPHVALYFRNDDVFLWDMSNATDLSYMFRGASFFDGTLLGTWDTSRVINMNGMFQETATAVSQWAGDLSTWDVSNVMTADRMFYASQVSFTETNNNISSWKLSSLRSAVSMFELVVQYQYDLCPWGPYLVGRPVTVTDMFRTTACFNAGQSTADPNLSLPIPGPFCQVCTIDYGVDFSKSSSSTTKTQRGYVVVVVLELLVLCWTITTIVNTNILF